MLALAIQLEKPELEVKKTELLHKEEELKVQLSELEESLLEVFPPVKLYSHLIIHLLFLLNGSRGSFGSNIFTASIQR